MATDMSLASAAVPMASDWDYRYQWYQHPDSTSQTLPPMQQQQQQLAERIDLFSQINMFASELPSEDFATTVQDPLGLEDSDDPFYTQARIMQMCLQDYPEPELEGDGNLVINESYGPCSSYGYLEGQGNDWTAEASGTASPGPMNLVTSTTRPVEDADDKLTCSACGHRFSKKAAFLRHLRVKHGPRVWHVCEVCGKGLASLRSLRYHMCQHTGERLFPCPEPGCGAGFMRRTQLLQHEAAEHAGGLPRPVNAVGTPLQVVHRHVGVDGGGLVYAQVAGESSSVGLVVDASAGYPCSASTTSGSDCSVSASDSLGSPVDDFQKQQHHPELVIRLVRKEPGSWEVAMP